MVIGESLNSLSNFQPSKGARRGAYLDKEALSWSRRRCLQDKAPQLRGADKHRIRRVCLHTLRAMSEDSALHNERSSPSFELIARSVHHLRTPGLKGAERTSGSAATKRLLNPTPEKQDVLKHRLWKWVSLISGNDLSCVMYAPVYPCRRICIRA